MFWSSGWWKQNQSGLSKEAGETSEGKPLEKEQGIDVNWIALLEASKG